MSNAKHQLLSDIYFNPEHPAGLGGVQKLYQYSKLINPEITLKDVKDWLSGQYVYTLHKPARRHFKRNRIYVSYIDEMWEADLVDLQHFSNQNNGFKYLITIIDVFSKYLFVYSIKNKTSVQIVKMFKDLFKRRKPVKLRCDKGKEFDNSLFKNFCKENKVNFFLTENTDIKCAVVERVNRTLKNKLFRYFTLRGTRRYIDVIQKLVENYNNSIHRSIKMKPSDVVPENENIVFENLYGAPDILSILNQRKKPEFKIGDHVRQKYKLNMMDKSYYPLWTDVVYKIENINRKLKKPQYELELDGVKLKKRFYPEEIQKVFIDNSTLWLVEKIVGYRTIRGQRQALIKFRGYPNSHNQWIPLDQIQNL
jgi:hypothetical protein